MLLFRVMSLDTASPTQVDIALWKAAILRELLLVSIVFQDLGANLQSSERKPEVFEGFWL